jgi:tetraacyldisaccharide 4'-kinase
LIVNVLSSMYGAAASWRRRWYARDPARTRRLERPVVSVGNLRAGGSGKTPVVAHLAHLLLDRGERPSILTRGYGRPRTTPGVTVVSDGRRILAGFETAGDEPLMLARALPAVAVLVGADRYASGRLAERDLGVTVHILDDGFQHLALARDADLLLVDASDLSDRLLPAGRLREPVASAALADAVLVTAADAPAAAQVAAACGVSTSFLVRRRISAPRTIDGLPSAFADGTKGFAFAGIAKAERFFDDLSRAGYGLAGTMTFRDHHVYTPRDVEAVTARARAAGASFLLTTEKDAERLRGLGPSNLPLGVIPLTAEVEPAAPFGAWLTEQLRAARS